MRALLIKGLGLPEEGARNYISIEHDGTVYWHFLGTEQKEEKVFAEELIKDNERLMAACAREWISVEERLPEPGMRVIIARPYEPGQPLRVEQGCYSANGWWKVFGTNVKRVKYWMPMPEPPKEEA